MQKQLYTQEQVDIKLLESKADDTRQTLQRLDITIAALNSHMKTQYSNLTNYTLGIYGLILCAVLAHLKGIF